MPYLSASAVVIHCEEALYQVYAPFTFNVIDISHEISSLQRTAGCTSYTCIIHSRLCCNLHIVLNFGSTIEPSLLKVPKGEEYTMQPTLLSTRKLFLLQQHTNSSDVRHWDTICKVDAYSFVFTSLIKRWLLKFRRPSG